jgi:methyltransferase-like protein
LTQYHPSKIAYKTFDGGIEGARTQNFDDVDTTLYSEIQNSLATASNFKPFVDARMKKSVKQSAKQSLVQKQRKRIESSRSLNQSNL